MNLDKNKTTFGRHETFPLRYGWLTKGVEVVSDNKHIFHEREHEKAMTKLGMGRNMVNALHYWLRVTGLVTFEDGSVGEEHLDSPLASLQLVNAEEGYGYSSIDCMKKLSIRNTR